MLNNKKQKIKVICNLCGKNVRGNSKAVCCDVCDNWVHIKCNGISASRYDELCNEDKTNPSFVSNALTMNYLLDLKLSIHSTKPH